MTLTFQKATKEQAKLRLALFGPSGSGKTYTSLLLAQGLGGKVALIDTERGSASKYADRFDFDTLDLPKRDIETYVGAIKAAKGYDVLIVDSLSHGWFELLAEVERIARARYRGNTWSAWSEGTPKQRALVDAILGFGGHIIATMRVKTEWAVEDRGGKSRPVRVGTEPQQGKGIEYEFDLLGEMTHDHILTISKDRTGRFQDRVIDKPGEDLGRELAEWLKDGAKPEKIKKKAEKSKKPEPTESFNAAAVAAVIKAGLTENSYSFAGAMQKSNVPVDAPEEWVVNWFRHYREAREAEADSDEAATQANAWFDGERTLYEAMTYRTNSGKVLGQLGPDELADMVVKIEELSKPSAEMKAIRQHCLTLMEYLKQFEEQEQTEENELDLPFD